MGLLDPIKRAIHKATAPPQHVNNQQKAFGSFSVPIESSPVVRAIKNCGVYNPNADPRALVPLHRIYYEALAWFPFADRLRSQIAGRLMADTGDEGMDAGLQSMMDNLMLYHPDLPSRHRLIGVNALDSIAKSIKRRDGEFFAEIDFLDSENLRDPKGIKVYDSLDFYFQQLNIDQYQLYFNRNGVERPVIDSDHFYECVNEWDGRYLWGKGIMHGAQFLNDIAIYMLISRKNAHLRLGNPPTQTIIGVKERELDGGFSDKERSDIEEFLSGIAKARAASQKAMTEGKIVDDLFPIPHDVTMNQSVYGQGVQGITDWVDDISFIGGQIVQLTGVPPQLAGFPGASSGIGSDQFRIMLGLMKSSIDDESRKTERDVIIPSLKAMWIGMRENPRFLDRIKVKRDSAGLDDSEKIANIAKTEAETLEIQLRNILSVRTDMASIDGAEQLAEEIGINIDVNSIPEFPEPEF